MLIGLDGGRIAVTQVDRLLQFKQSFFFVSAAGVRDS